MQLKITDAWKFAPRRDDARAIVEDESGQLWAHERRFGSSDYRLYDLIACVKERGVIDTKHWAKTRG